jgi:regulator of protease activity HflC (stomatin/prohibitin superfamily)
MPAVVIERANLPTEMRDALKKHILRERQRKKEEADANEADKQRRREEKAKALSSSKVQLEDNAKNILQLERAIADLQQQKAEQYNLLKRALTEEDRRKHSQQTLTKEPSWTSLYSPSKKRKFFLSKKKRFLLKIFKWHSMLIILNIIYPPNHHIVY